MDKLTSRFTIAMTQIPCFWSDLSNLVIVVKILPIYLYLLTNILCSYFCLVFCRLLFVLCSFSFGHCILTSLLLFTASDYPFGLVSSNISVNARCQYPYPANVVITHKYMIQYS